MKKFFTIISVITITATGALAQALPNNGFEAWTPNASPAYDTPNSWSTLNPTTVTFGGVITCFKATAAGDFHNGTAALKLVTKTVATQVVNGIATTGTIDVLTQKINGGIAYTGRPDSLVGFYKYTPVNTDNGFIQMILTGAGGDTDTVGIATFKTPATTVAAYTRFSAKFTYKSTNAVAKALCIISSSASATVHFDGSILFVDDLDLISIPTDIKESSASNVAVGPNPAADFLIVKNPETANINFLIYDVTGRKMTEQVIVNKTNTIDLNEFKNGIYMYSITNESKKVIKTGRIIVQK